MLTNLDQVTVQQHELEVEPSQIKLILKNTNTLDYPCWKCLVYYCNILTTIHKGRVDIMEYTRSSQVEWALVISQQNITLNCLRLVLN